MAIQIKEVPDPTNYNDKVMSVRIGYDKPILMPLSLFYELKVEINKFASSEESE